MTFVYFSADSFLMAAMFKFRVPFILVLMGYTDMDLDGFQDTQ